MSLIRLNKQVEPTVLPPVNKVFLGVNSTGPYMQDENGLLTYIGVTPPQAPSNVYGSELNVFEANLPTVSQARITHLAGTTTVLPVGRYKITVAYCWNYNDTKTSFISYFHFGGLALGSKVDGQIHRQEPQDKGSLEHFCCTKVFYTNIVTPATKTISLEYMPEDVKDASMWDASVEVIRIS